MRANGLGAIADGVLGRWFSASFHDTHPEIVSGFREMLVSVPTEGYAACCEVLADTDLTGRLGEIAAPTLVVTGAEDPTVPPAAGDALAAAIPGAGTWFSRAQPTSPTSSSPDRSPRRC